MYVDDRTGTTYVVTDDEPEEAAAAADHQRQKGRLSRRLSDSMAWLDGLTDEQYDDYMVRNAGNRHTDFAHDWACSPESSSSSAGQCGNMLGLAGGAVDPARIS